MTSKPEPGSELRPVILTWTCQEKPDNEDDRTLRIKPKLSSGVRRAANNLIMTI
jgi:hypothetical protein